METLPSFATGVPASSYYQTVESDDEESFVVLSSSLPPESIVSVSKEECVHLAEMKVIQESLRSTETSILELGASTSSYPSIPIQNLKPASVPSSVKSGSSNDFSPDEIQQKVEMLIDENMKLKETLHQNNLAMKKQYDTLVMWQDDVLKVHESHKEKFAETKRYIENLKQENTKLSEALSMSEAAKESIQSECNMLKLQLLDVGDNKLTNDYSLLKSSLEMVDKEKFQYLQSQLDSAKMEMEHLNKQLQNNQSIIVENGNLQSELTATKTQFNELSLNYKDMLDKESKLRESTNVEIARLKGLLLEQNSLLNIEEMYKKSQEQLMQAQMHITGLNQQLASNQDLMNGKATEVQKLNEELKHMLILADTNTALKEQLNIYKSDFELEQNAKISIKTERDQIAEDLRHLQRRNQQLMEEVEQLRTKSEYVHVSKDVPSSSQSPSAPNRRHKRVSYCCPKCQFAFKDYQSLQNHVDRCIKDYFYD